MDELAPADVDTHVGGTAGTAARLQEEDQIAGLELTHRDGGAVAHLSGSSAVEGAAKLRVDIADKAGAVKTAGGGAAVTVGIAQILHGQIHHLGGGAGRGGLGCVDNGHIVRGHIALFHLVPAVQGLQNGEDLASREGVHLLTVGAGGGADIQGALRDLAVDGLRHSGQFYSLRQHYIIGGDIALSILEGDLVPAAFGNTRHLNLGAVGDGLQNGGVGAGSVAQTKTALGVHCAGHSKSRSDHTGDSQQAGGQLGSKRLRKVHGGSPPDRHISVSGARAALYFVLSARSSQTVATSIAVYKLSFSVFLTTRSRLFRSGSVNWS